MNKSLIALVFAGSFVLAGCSSSGGASSHDGDFVVDRPEPVDPGFGLQIPTQPPVDNAPDRPTPEMGDTPDWGLDSPVDRPEPTDPEFGVQVPTQPPVDNTPDRPTPDMGDTPDWGISSPVERPEPVDPNFGLQLPTQPDVDNTPERPQPDMGDTPNWGISTDPEVSPAINSIDRNKVRDALRTRLNG